MTPLSPLGSLYGLVIKARNSLYDRQIFKSYRPDAKVISIGNITTGGTGKTPLVALTARLLAENGEKVCILTRGYGRKDPADQVLVSDGERVLVDAGVGGDEPVELGRKLIGKAAIVADSDRVAAAKWAVKNLGSTAFVLDDGFQHRRLARELDIVCIDAVDPFGNGEILPAGRLRESVSGLKRAHAIVITRADLVDEVSAIEREIGNNAPAAKIFRARSKITRFAELAGDRSVTDPGSVSGFAFCAIGNPAAFFRQLETANIQVGGTKTFRDHHRFTRSDVAELEREAMQSGCDVLITTAKDAVRLTGLVPTMPCYVAETEMELDDIEGFKELILSS